MDAILGVMVVAFIAILVASLSFVTKSNSRAIRRLQASVIADEEISALKRLPIANISDQTNGLPLNILANAGTWSVVADSANVDAISAPCPPPTTGKHCGQNVLNVSGGASFAGKINGRLLFPADAYGDTTIQSSWYVVNDSPTDWIVGYYLRARDIQNGYRLRIGSATTDLAAAAGTQNIVFEKIVNGTPTALFTSSGVVNIPTNTWVSIRVVMSGNAFSIYKDGALLTGGSFTDGSSTYAVGRVALAAWNGAHARADDVTEIDSSSCNASPSKCWNFEAESVVPTAWTRFGHNDLPDSTATTFDDNLTVTLEPWPAGATDIKRATVTVSWRDALGSQSLTAVGYLRKENIGL